jgi:hypothetical protein
MVLSEKITQAIYPSLGAIVEALEVGKDNSITSMLMTVSIFSVLY